MKIESTSFKGSFKIVKGSFDLVQVDIVNFFTKRAMVFYRGGTLEIKPKNFWGRKFDIIKNHNKIGQIIIKIKGTILLSLISEKEVEHESYIIKPLGFWKNRFQLLDEEESLFFTLKAKWIWRKFQYDLLIEDLNERIEYDDLIDLLIFSAFGANVYLAMRSSGGS